MTLNTDLGARAVGSVLTSVSYYVIWDFEPKQCKVDVDEVSMAVRIVFKDGFSLDFRWPMEGSAESLVMRDGADASVDPTWRSHDASGRWATHVGSRLELVVALGQSGPEGEVTWAYRLMFSNGRGLVIALGECTDGGLTYIPDSLVVIGSKESADAYRPDAALTSLWGDG